VASLADKAAALGATFSSALGSVGYFFNSFGQDLGSFLGNFSLGTFGAGGQLGGSGPFGSGAGVNPFFQLNMRDFSAGKNVIPNAEDFKNELGETLDIAPEDLKDISTETLLGLLQQVLPEEFATLMGGLTGATEADIQEWVHKSTENLIVDMLGLDGVPTYGDPNFIDYVTEYYSFRNGTETERSVEYKDRRLTETVEQAFKDLGYNPSPEEIDELKKNPSGVAEYVDPRQVTNDEVIERLERLGVDVEGQAEAAGQTPEEYAEQIKQSIPPGDGSEAAFDDAMIMSLTSTAAGGTGSASFKEALSKMGTGVKNLLFGTNSGRPKPWLQILKEQIEKKYFPTFEDQMPGFPLAITFDLDGASAANPTGAVLRADLKIPVPFPINGPPIIIPIFDVNGNYVGPSTPEGIAGLIIDPKTGVIAQVVDGVKQTVAQIKGEAVQILGAAGDVIRSFPLGLLENPDWKEGDPNPFELEVDGNGDIAPQTDENGNPATGYAPDTGLPVYEKEEEEEDPVVSRSPYEDGSASDAFRNSSWPDPDPDAQDTYSSQIEEMFLVFGLDTNQWPEGTELNISTLDGQPVDANEDGIYTVEELATVGITRAAGYDPRMFLGNDARLVLNTLEDTLDGLGLDVDDIETILGRIETDLQNVTTAEDLETFRTNLVNELLDPDTGLPSMGIDEDELGDALDPITKSVDDLGTAIEAVAEDVTNLGETLNDRIDTLVAQGLSRAEAVDQALADLSDQLGTSTADILEQIGTTEANLAADIEAVAGDVTNLGETLNDRIDALVDQGLSRAEAVDQALADLADQLDTSTADILEQLGTTEANLAEDIEAVAEDVEAVAGDLSDLAGIVDGYIAQGLSNDEALAQAISDLSDQLGVTEDTLLTSLGETEETILDAVEDVNAQIAATNVSILDLNELVTQYELDGKTRDEAIQLAISDLSDKVGVTETNLLASIGESEETILGAIEGVNAQIDATNVNIDNLNALIVQYELDGKTRDEALSLALSDLSTDLGITKEEILTSIGETEETIIERIDASDESTDEYLTYISEIIGIPATDLTQEDIDFVVGLIGEDEAITEINNDVRIYDANFDGVINDIDIGLLQGFVDAGVDGVGEIPATGLYADAAQRQLELTGYISDQDDITRGLISDEAKATRGLMGATTLFNAMLGAGDISGTRVDVSTPDPARINYIYDFEDVFATPQQKSLFPSPYGKPQMAQQQQMAQRQSSMSGPLQIGGMAQGGKVDYDFTDEIMQIMRYGDN